MTEDKPIAKPIIDDATREKMALMFSGEVYLPDDVDGFFDLQAAQRDLQLELNATPLTNPKRRTELMQAFFGAAGEGLYLISNGSGGRTAATLGYLGLEALAAVAAWRLAGLSSAASWEERREGGTDIGI